MTKEEQQAAIDNFKAEFERLYGGSEGRKNWDRMVEDFYKDLDLERVEPISAEDYADEMGRNRR